MPSAVPTDFERRPMAVIGGGTLGRRIALMLATRGGEVRIVDPSPAQREAAADYVRTRLPRLVDRLDGASAGTAAPHERLSDAVADVWLVVEAVPERLDLKQRLFADLDRVAPPDAVLASNSSSFPTSRMIGDVTRPERVVNLHFYMPPRAVAVEVMSSGHTDPALISLLMDRLPDYGLVPFEVRKESTGFIYNRVWAAIKREALAVVAEGVATPQDVDRIFELSLGAPFGPFRMMDAVGLDVALDIEEHYATEREGVPEGPRQLLRQHIAEGRLGVKSGRGFYDDYGTSPATASRRSP